MFNLFRSKPVSVSKRQKKISFNNNLFFRIFDKEQPSNMVSRLSNFFSKINPEKQQKKFRKSPRFRNKKSPKKTIAKK